MQSSALSVKITGMKLIRQRESWDCGIAVAAMLTRSSYDEVLNAAISLNENLECGLTISNLHKLLKKLGKSQKTYRFDGWKKISLADWFDDYVGRDYMGAVTLLGTMHTLTGHFVAIEKRMVYDPALGCFSMTEYPNSGYYVPWWLGKTLDREKIYGSLPVFESKTETTEIEVYAGKKKATRA